MRNTSIVPTQIEVLTNHMTRVGSISGLEALALYRIVSLTRQITTLKRKGLTIFGEWRKDNTGKRYKRYFMNATSPSLHNSLNLS
jgi:hypothetical protein